MVKRTANDCKEERQKQKRQNLKAGKVKRCKVNPEANTGRSYMQTNGCHFSEDLCTLPIPFLWTKHTLLPLRGCRLSLIALVRSMCRLSHHAHAEEQPVLADSREPCVDTLAHSVNVPYSVLPDRMIWKLQSCQLLT